MIRLALRNFSQLCRSHKALTLISFTCAICMIAAFLIENGMDYRYVSDTEESEFTYIGLMSDDSEALWQLYERLSGAKDLPAIQAFTLANKHYAGLYWNFESNESAPFTPYGRFFTDEEINSGANVALISTKIIDQLRFDQVDTLWDNPIDAGGEQLTLIGDYRKQNPIDNERTAILMLKSDAFAADVIMPLSVFRRTGIQPEFLHCRFCALLTEAQIHRIRDMVGGMDGASSLIIHGNQQTIRSVQQEYLRSSIIVIALALILMNQVFIHWIRGEFARYRVYLICGAKRSRVVIQLLLETFLFATASFLAAYVFYAIVLLFTPETVMVATPLPSTALVWFLLTLILAAAELIQTAPLIFRDRLLKNRR